MTWHLRLLQNSAIAAVVFFVGIADAVNYRTFTAKSGQQIEAKVVSLSSDQRFIKIERRDAQVFDLEIIRLSLTDQQYLRNWLNDSPEAVAEMTAPTTEYVIDVGISKSEGNRVRTESSFYKYLSTPIGYTLTVTNKSRETLVGGSLQYFVMLDNQIRIIEEEEDRELRWSTLVVDTLTAQSMTVPIEDLIFNRDIEVTTEQVIEEVVLGDGNERYGADELIGVIGVIKDASGAIIEEFRFTSAEGNQYTWDGLVKEFGEPSTDPAEAFRGRKRVSAP